MPVRAALTHDVVVTFERVFGMLRRVLPVDELSLTAASTLHRLELTGARRLTELAGLEGVTQPAMTQLVSRLERAGLAQRQADPQDGRVVLVEITDRGRGFDFEAVQARRDSLGLTGLCERVILAGGRPEIFSRVGQGTRIHAEFPLAPSPS